MNHALVTINAGGVLCENARASFQAVAERWGAAYVELVPGQNTPMIHPLLCKMRLFELTNAERIFYIDGADAIIREDAPSPFEACPPYDLGVVRNSHESYPDFFDVSRQEEQEWTRIAQGIGKTLKPKQPYFNAGMMVLTRAAHARLLDRACEIHAQTRLPLAWREQTVLNYVAQELDIPMLFMDYTWNYLHPERVNDWAWMEHYVYHYAGLPERYTTLASVNWRTPPHGWERKRSPDGGLTMIRLRRALRRIPLIGSLVRYLYWWATLPAKVNFLSDQVHILNELGHGTRFLVNDLRAKTLPHVNEAQQAPDTPPEDGDRES